MANVKISQLPAASTLIPNADVAPIVHSGVTQKATPNQIVQSVLPAPGPIGGTTPSTATFSALTLVSASGLQKAVGGLFTNAVAGTDYYVPGGALGTPSSGTLTNCTGLPVSTGISGLGTGIATFLGTPSSANLAAAITDETGSGALVFATSPTLVTPILGTPTSGTLTNCTGLPLSTGVTGTLPVSNGGTGVTTITGLVKGNGSSAFTAAVSGTDYAPATSGTSILYGNGAGGFSNVTVGSGLSFAGGTLSASGGSGTVTSVSIVTANGLAGTVATATTTPAITLSTTVTGLLKGNGTAISAATSGTDYAPATSGTSILKGNGSGGFASATAGTDYAAATTGTSSQLLGSNGSGGFTNVTVGSGLTYVGGTLASVSGGGGTVTNCSVVTANGFAGTVATSTTTPAITITTSVTGLLKGNGTAVSAATAGTDYAAAPTGTSAQLLANNGSGGFSNITVGTGLSLAAGTLSATGGGTVTSVTASTPLASSGGTTPNLTIQQASGSQAGYLSSTDWTTFNSKAASGANSDITSMSGLTGGLSTVDHIDFNTTTATTSAVGRAYWDGGTTLNLGMTANVTQKVGESEFYYVKASSAITIGQLVMFTGTVGSSGVITVAPATGLTVAQYAVGIAAESIALNGFGMIQSFGVLRGFDTTGTSVGETWANGDVLYYNSAYTGGLTKVYPASGPIVIVAAVINAASGGSGSLQIRTTFTQRITATSPLTSTQTSSGTALSISQATTSTSGYLSSTDWNTFNGKAPATSGTSILYGNGSGGFSNVTVGTGLSFAGGTLAATGGSMVYPGAGIPVSTGSAWNTSKTAPTGNIVGTSDTQTLTNKTALAATNTIEATSGPNTTQLSGNRNKIINGAMMIDQRNAGASVSATSTYTLDRWQAVGTQSSKFTVQQNAGSITPPVGFSNYLGVTSSSAYSVLTNDTFDIQQPVEGLNCFDLAWGTANAKSVTLSFQVYSSLTGTFGGALANSAGNRSYPFSYSIPVANTWTQIAVTVSGDTTGTWLTNNGIGINVRFGLGSGSTFTGTAGAWAASNLVQSTGSVSVVGTSGATFYITGVQLEKGATATPFENRLYGTELALCQRYYEKTYAVADVPGAIDYSGIGTYVQATNSYTTVQWMYRVTKRAAPTVTAYSPNTGASGKGRVNGGDVTVATDGASTNYAIIYANNVSISAGDYFRVDAIAQAEL